MADTVPVSSTKDTHVLREMWRENARGNCGFLLCNKEKQYIATVLLWEPDETAFRVGSFPVRKSNNIEDAITYEVCRIELAICPTRGRNDRK